MLKHKENVISAVAIGTMNLTTLFTLCAMQLNYLIVRAISVCLKCINIKMVFLLYSANPAEMMESIVIGQNMEINLKKFMPFKTT